MFAYIEGDLAYKSPSLIYLSTNGIGYEVNITLQTYGKVQALDRCRLYIHLQVREDAWVMYGFADEEERTTFRYLLAISGVGSATARIILSSLTPTELERTVALEDTRTLEKVKGIGAKTAQRIILELKGKLQLQNSGVINPKMHNTKENDALFALVNLGINKSVAENALRKINDSSLLTTEELIKQALQVL